MPSMRVDVRMMASLIFLTFRGLQDIRKRSVFVFEGRRKQHNSERKRRNGGGGGRERKRLAVLRKPEMAGVVAESGKRGVECRGGGCPPLITKWKGK
ncbi:hypothetical protein CEXT_702491 [Caerostris extrusa]|uniref:Uncharacterized protein n=1 Tax=Caerostris extrusa TaxID=172846 RepID=A0AAV4TFE3_CAEEX|nr:hypothetical protein CEXT_702491 [Caerostris extrusa]